MITDITGASGSASSIGTTGIGVIMIAGVIGIGTERIVTHARFAHQAKNTRHVVATNACVTMLARTLRAFTKARP
jgi:hypothetical protein